MPDAVSLLVDGSPVAAEGGITVAAALESAGRRTLRLSPSGEPRGVLCAMGICFECRVTIDGEPHRRACMEAVREGMQIWTRAGSSEFRVPNPESRVPSSGSRVERLECDVAVVGGGPAGIAAACRAAEADARAILLDDYAEPGGQIHRRLPGREPPPAARAWLARLSRSGARVLSRAAVFDAARDGAGWRLAVQTPEKTLAVSARAVVLATGSRELFLPFPGWTLPGVLGAGGAQALWKSGASLAGRTAVVAGSGPLLLPVAASLAKAGARVVCVAEQAGPRDLARFAGGLLRSPSKIRDAARYRRAFAAAPYRAGAWIAEARGRERLEGVVLADARGGRTELACDLAAVGWGLTPNVELARLLGCAVTRDGAGVDARQQTGVEGVFCAGEACGIAGVEAAIAEGQIAGAAAAGRLEGAWDFRALSRARASARRFSSRLRRAFRLRPELARLPRPDTIVCRCEDVPLGPLRDFSGAREAKLAARAGMGPCQGRVCGPALSFLFGWDSDTVRTPIQPVPLEALAALAGEEGVE
jgi:D-hydroxyproline dehydrogenase subunit alpha